MKIGDTVFSQELDDNGTILSIDSDLLRVEFEFNGFTIIEKEEVTLSNPTIEVEPEVEETVYNFTSIVNLIKGSAQDRGSMFAFGNSTFNKIEMLADEKGHFVGSIIENARNKKFISEKQAYAVAYFANENGLINA